MRVRVKVRSEARVRDDAWGQGEYDDWGEGEGSRRLTLTLTLTRVRGGARTATRMHDALPVLEVGSEGVHGGRPVAPLAYS